jgi:hypothetical protein
MADRSTRVVQLSGVPSSSIGQSSLSDCGDAVLQTLPARDACWPTVHLKRNGHSLAVSLHAAFTPRTFTRSFYTQNASPRGVSGRGGDWP